MIWFSCCLYAFAVTTGFLTIMMNLVTGAVVREIVYLGTLILTVIMICCNIQANNPKVISKFSPNNAWNKMMK